MKTTWVSEITKAEKRSVSFRSAALTLTLLAGLANVGLAGYSDAIWSNTGLISYWNLNEIVDTTAIDLVGGNDGTYSGAGYTVGQAGPRPGDGFQGFSSDNYAPSFSGTTTQTLSMNPANYAGLTDLSMSLWFRFDGGTTNNHIGGLEDTTGSRYVFATHQYTNSLSSFAKRSDGGQTSVSSGTINDSQWHHLAVTYESVDIGGGQYNATLKAYIDGQLKNSGTATTTTPGLDAADMLVFARDPGDSANRNLNGQLDEIAFFSKSLSAAEVDNQYAAGTSGYVGAVNETGPAHYWRFNEPTGAAAYDAIGGKTASHHSGFPPVAGSGPASVAGPGPTDGFAGMETANTGVLYNIAGKTRSIADNPDLVGDGSFAAGDMTGLSMEFWYKHGATDNEGVLAGYQDTSGGGRYAFTVMKVGGASNGLRVYGKDASGNQTQYSLNDTPDTDWHHMVLAWDGAHLRSYLDGQETAASVTSSAGSASGAIGPINELVFGGDASTVNSRYYNGALDNVAIYNRPLTNAQVARHYEAAVTGSYSMSPAETAALGLNPVHYWRMEETYGQTVLDSIGNWTGTLQNNPVLGDVGPRPYAFPGFDADNHAVGFVRTGDTGISVTDVDQLAPGMKFSEGGVDALSMSAWFRLSETGPDNARQIIAGFQKSAGNRYTFLTTRESDGKLKFYLSDGDDQSKQIVASPYSGITDSEWHHVVMTWDGSALRTYLDGENEQMFTNAAVQGALFAPEGFYIGRDTAGGSAFDGHIDEVALFNYALGADDVWALYQGAMVPEPSALLLLGFAAVGFAVLPVRRRHASHA